MKILGISAYYHDSAASILVDGKLIAAAQEERFTRIKHDAQFPKNAILFCCKKANCSISDIDYITFYDKPLVKFERLLETYLTYAPRGIQSFIKAMPVWLKEKLFLKSILKKEINSCCLGKFKGKLLFTEHHQAHASSAFFASPFSKAAILCLDGVGEWATTSLWIGEKNSLTSKWEIHFPHSLGLLYSSFTSYIGFKVNSGEYKLMGLAPYGEPKYVQTIYDHLIDVKPDGSFSLNMEYFSYPTGSKMINEKFENLFGGPALSLGSKISHKEMDLAKSIQVVTEEIILKIVNNVKAEFGVDSLCLAGGVALNCVSNGRLLRDSAIKNLWIQPASGDAGGALGACYSTWYEYLNQDRVPCEKLFSPYLGPEFSDNEIKSYLDSIGARYEELSIADMIEKTSNILVDQNVVGWFQGRMEFGPRALGGRSIIGDPRSTKMQSIMNLKIKYRESFRPFAPAIISSAVQDWFELEEPSPYMLLVSEVKKNKQKSMTEEDAKLFGIEKLNVVRSEIPAVTHVDYSARVQTVHSELTPLFYDLIKTFGEKTGCPILINTSFNVRGEPIVCSPEDAFRCFVHTEMDVLVMGNFIVRKIDQTQNFKDLIKQIIFEMD